METLARWSTGMFVSLAIGQLVTGLFLKSVRNHYKIELGSSTSPGIPAYVIGLVERLFFTIIVAFNISATAIAMIGWLTVKMVSNWNRTGGSSSADFAPAALSALLGGMVSMLFALLGGLICSGQIRFW